MGGSEVRQGNVDWPGGDPWSQANGVKGIDPGF